MGSTSTISQIPVIDFSSVPSRGTERWQSMCRNVREACENYGCFEVVNYVEHRAETFSVVKGLFELPLETKRKNENPKPYHGYAGGYAAAPLSESFGVEDASNLKSVNSFVELMWPTSGSDHFSELNDERGEMIGKLILDSYGVGENLDTIMPCKTLLRIMRYSAPVQGEYMNGLNGHTDKLLSALICSDQVSGLELETKDEQQWIRWSSSPNSFIFIVGDPLKIWSNGRMHAARHRVMMAGDKERYSLAAFPVPIEGTSIKPAKELVDDEHPQIAREFDFMGFLDFSFSEKGNGYRIIDANFHICWELNKVWK